MWCVDIYNKNTFEEETFIYDSKEEAEEAKAYFKCFPEVFEVTGFYSITNKDLYDYLHF